MTEWFEQWFGEEYHALYPHRDEEDARRAVALIQRVVPWQSGDAVLDLACGPGRHAAELERLGARVVGFDLSRAMLRRARERNCVSRFGKQIVRNEFVEALEPFLDQIELHNIVLAGRFAFDCVQRFPVQLQDRLEAVLHFLAGGNFSQRFLGQVADYLLDE